MFIQVHKPSKETRNAGSSQQIINYLEKENADLDLVDETPFFSHEEDAHSAEFAKASLDHNHQGLKANDSKFFMLTINPSQDELKHLQNDPEKLKEYTRSVMDSYAKNFNRSINTDTQKSIPTALREKLQGSEMLKDLEKTRPLEGKDLIYFAKIEHDRRYDIKDKTHQETYKVNQKIRNEINICKRDIKYNNDNPLNEKKLLEKIEKLEKSYVRDKDQTIILAGNIKPGNNMHIHVVVSRKDKSQKVSLSPFANARNAKNELNGKKVQIGFDRQKFVDVCEKKFDKSFNYERAEADKFQNKYNQKHEVSKYITTMVNTVTDPEKMVQHTAKKIVTEMFDKDKRIQSMLQPLKRFPKTEKQAIDKLQNKAIDAVSKLLAGGANPTATAIRMVVQKVVDVGMSQGLTF